VHGKNCPAADGGMFWTCGVVSAGWLVIARRLMRTKPHSGFWQEIYDNTGKLVEIHEKYPLDRDTKKCRIPQW
jgi:hypothetical protein